MAHTRDHQLKKVDRAWHTVAVIDLVYAYNSYWQASFTMTAAIANSLRLDRWAEAQRLSPDLAQFRKPSCSGRHGDAW